MIRSRPESPKTRSTPPKATIRSLPPSAQITSLPGVPISVSLAAEPTIVQMSPSSMMLTVAIGSPIVAFAAPNNSTRNISVGSLYRSGLTATLKVSDWSVAALAGKMTEPVVMT